MQALEPIVTAHPLTGAFRPLLSDLLAEIYLAPRPTDRDVSEQIADPAAPWAKSHEVAPQETAKAVLDGLRNLALATTRLSPDEIDLSSLDPDSRIFRHLEALRGLWQDDPGILPADLQVMRHVLSCEAGDTLESLPLVTTESDPFATTAERALLARLHSHHGNASGDAVAVWAGRRTQMLRGGASGTSLAAAQDGLSGGAVSPVPLDQSVSFHALRDLADEAEFAAARVQRLVDGGIAPQDIALLVPDEAAYHRHLARAFSGCGVPLSGLPSTEDLRDHAGETLLLLLTCLREPAPAMALASLYVSPLMPWPADTGALMAREVMQGRFEPYAARALTGRARQMFALLKQDAPTTGDALSQRLEALVKLLTESEDRRDAVAAMQTRIGALRPMLSSPGEPDWASVFRAVMPQPIPMQASERFVEGVSVITESALPWRPARHLIALGMAGGRWPRPVSVSPLFLDGELEILKRATGLALPTRSDQLRRRLELLHRQFLLASESLTLLRPLRGLDGARQGPSPALSLIARTVRDPDSSTVKGLEDGERLLHPVRAVPPSDWPVDHRAASPKTTERALPADGVLDLHVDLLRARGDTSGLMKPQSPSRLETLLVSPLAWALGEYDAQPVPWGPETLDVMRAGTLAHAVLETLFTPDADLPDDVTIRDRVPGLLSTAIRRNTPFLQAAVWAVERQQLEREVLQAALAWRDVLAGLGARVIDNEIKLAGEALGIRLHGRADCLLKLPDGQILIIDHKKSGTTRRRERMVAGWDLQLGLYRAMLRRPEAGSASLDALLEAAPPGIGVAYHLMNDHGVLAQGLRAPANVVEVLDLDISEHALAQLLGRIAEVANGKLRLNTDADEAFFAKSAKMTPYALSASPLVSAFMVSAGEADDAENASDD